MNYYGKKLILKNTIINALKEDIGRKDITTESFIPKDKSVKAVLIAKEDCVVCGLDIAKLVFKTRDRKIKFKPKVLDGQYIKKESILAQLQGQATSILTAERVALNFLSLLCGIATKTREYIDKVKHFKVKIMDTRKTIPGLRDLEKHAVRTGGGYNHRFRLDEMVLIKDNHLKVVGDKLWVTDFKKIKNKILPRVKIEIETKTLKDFKKALKIRPDIIMLDNMSIKDIKKAVQLRNRNSLSPNTYHLTPKLEVSGGINLKNVRKFAATGIDMISIGALTHSVKSVNISLEVL